MESCTPGSVGCRPPGICLLVPLIQPLDVLLWGITNSHGCRQPLIWFCSLLLLFSNLLFCFLSFCLCFFPVLRSGREPLVSSQLTCSPSSCCQRGLTTPCGYKELCLMGRWAALRQHRKMRLHCMLSPHHEKWVLGPPCSPGCGTRVVKAQQTPVLRYETV